MLSFEPRIAIVDDKISEVEGIISHYQNEGIGIKHYNPHPSEGDHLPSNSFSNLNLIYLDIHFTESTSDYDPEICAGWVDALIPKFSFYILVIWSKETDKRDEILEVLDNENKKPFICITKQKTDYQENGGYNFSNLNESILEELNNYPELEELTCWKKSIINSSNIVLGHLSNASPSPDHFKSKLQKIILGHGGRILIGSGRANLKRETLFDAMDSILSSNSKSTRPEIEISEENRNVLYNITSSPGTEIDKKLNSWFHFKLIDTQTINSNELSPGLISLNQHRFLKNLYSIQDDPKLESKLSTQIENESTRIRDITVILTRPCDHAQKKHGKNIKLLSGIQLINPRRIIDSDLSSRQRRNRNSYIGRLHFNNEELPDSVKIYDHLYFSEEDNDVALLFDYRYIFSIPESIFVSRFEHIKLFNKELLSELQVEYSAYSSRLGITQII